MGFFAGLALMLIGLKTLGYITCSWLLLIMAIIIVPITGFFLVISFLFVFAVIVGMFNL